MVAINIAETSRTPLVLVDGDRGVIEIAGESYPEDVTLFYAPILNEIGTWLDSGPAPSVECALKLIYFNSSSAKAIMMLLERLDVAAKDGATVHIRWFYDAEDETMLELGEDFREDIEHATFSLAELE